MLTACGIETALMPTAPIPTSFTLQQCLPLAVLKPSSSYEVHQTRKLVATVLTACGIETDNNSASFKKLTTVATVLTACGIETIIANEYS